MSRMRAYVREHNIYRWAGTLIAELAAVRLDSAGPQIGKPQSLAETGAIAAVR